MHHAQIIDLVRQHVRTTFSDQGVEQDDDCCETILIRDGFYCGRCFSSNNQRAIWFVEENVIKFYGPEGEFLKTQPVEDVQRLAAA